MSRAQQDLDANARKLVARFEQAIVRFHTAHGNFTARKLPEDDVLREALAQIVPALCELTAIVEPAALIRVIALLEATTNHIARELAANIPAATQGDN